MMIIIRVNIIITIIVREHEAYNVHRGIHHRIRLTARGVSVIVINEENKRREIVRVSI